MIYVLALILGLMPWLFGQFQKKEIENRLINVFFFFMTIYLLAAFRFGIGTDYITYYREYKQYDLSEGLAGKFEPLFLLIMYFLKILNAPPEIFFALISFFSYYFAFKSFSKEYYFLSMILFFIVYYLPSYSLIRQGFAIAVIMYSTKLLLTNNPIKSLCYALFAILIHMSAIIFIPLIVVWKFIRIKSGYVYIFLTLFMSILFVGYDIKSFILNIGLLDGTKYVGYLSSSFFEEAKIGSGLGLLLKLITPLMSMLFLSFVVRIDDSCSRRDVNFLLCANSLYVIASVVAVKISIFVRVTDILMFVLILTPLYIIEKLKNKTNRMLYTSVVIVCNVVVFLNLIITNNIYAKGGLGITPYNSIVF